MKKIKTLEELNLSSKKSRKRSRVIVTILILFPLVMNIEKGITEKDMDHFVISFLLVVDYILFLLLMAVLGQSMHRSLKRNKDLDRALKSLIRPDNISISQEDFTALTKGKIINKEGTKISLQDIGHANMIDIVLENIKG